MQTFLSFVPNGISAGLFDFFGELLEFLFELLFETLFDLIQAFIELLLGFLF